MNIGSVSCIKSKRDVAAQPTELYLESAFFRRARQYAEANQDAWYILSAKHHLLDPDGGAIEPHDEALSGASVETKREWAETVFEQLHEGGLLALPFIIGLGLVRSEFTWGSRRYRLHDLYDSEVSSIDFT